MFVFPNYLHKASKFVEMAAACEDKEHRPWADLPLELVDMIASHLPLVDRIRFPAVCKRWSSVSTSISDAKRWPWLMYLPDPTGGIYKFFDPLDGKSYTSPYQLSVDDYYYALRFSKYGWVVLSDEDIYIAVFEAFGDGWLYLPNLPHRLKNFSFSSPPTSSDCIVFGISGSDIKDDDPVRIVMWRYGDEDWSYQEPVNNLPFVVTENNPVFHEGMFYCLGRYGNLGVFDPEDKTWTVLERPILSPSMRLDTMIHRCTFECYLVESSKRELISVFDWNNGKSILVMKLDRSRMAWRKVTDLDDDIIFVSVRASISVPAPVKGTGNKIYFPRWYNDNNRKEGVYYCLKTNKFYANARSELEEAADCIWILPMIQKANTIA